MTNDAGYYRLFGLTQSYFTRKLTAYFDYKDIHWRLRRFGGGNPDVIAAGWDGGIPAVQAPDGEFMWDSTAVIEHLEIHRPEPAVMPPDSVQRFLCYLIEDVSDEWLYRPAVGSRWFFEENTAHGGWDLARELTVEAPVTCDEARELAGAHVRSSCGPLGVTEQTIGPWIDEVVRPWLRVLGAHFNVVPYLFGARPSLADFAVFGGNAAHFVNDPACRRWSEAEGPAVVSHTHRLLEPDAQHFGDWSGAGDVPETLVAILADLGRLYLPWVSRATVDGRATLAFQSGVGIEIEATPFLKEARAILLARYVALRSDELDAVLQRAGILSYFAELTEQAGAIPDYGPPPRPMLNRPFPPSEV